jgi:hypothetical protein
VYLLLILLNSKEFFMNTFKQKVNRVVSVVFVMMASCAWADPGSWPVERAKVPGCQEQWAAERKQAEARSAARSQAFRTFVTRVVSQGRPFSVVSWANPRR